jgi:hypothetical protein
MPVAKLQVFANLVIAPPAVEGNAVTTDLAERFGRWKYS